MQTLTISDQRQIQETILPDSFIDLYMPRANGEFVKIYLYLLRCAHKTEGFVSLSSAADFFSCPENDILRALHYWEQEGLLSLTFSGDTLTSVILSDGNDPDSHRLPNDQVSLLRKDNEEAQEILHVAEIYLNRLLTPNDMGRILYFYDSLHMSAELIEYILEHCASQGKTSIHYIEAVGLSWHKEGITTVEQARMRADSWSKKYYQVLHAFGISNRDPLPLEREIIDKWLDAYAFTMDLIEEAALRSVNKNAPFSYADKILSGWHEQGVKTRADAKNLDDIFRSNQKSRDSEAGNKAGNPGSGKVSGKNRFHNFEERRYDYTQLEKQLLNAQRKDQP